MKTWTNRDKSEWPDGPWDDEADKYQWIDDATGLDCLIVRGPAGALCGYVGVPESHSLFDVEYMDTYEKFIDLNAHGGITFSSRCDPGEAEGENICHTGEVTNATVWWFGFDCAHSGDLIPAYDWTFEGNNIYRKVPYVTEEVTSLASQLKEAA